MLKISVSINILRQDCLFLDVALRIVSNVVFLKTGYLVYSRAPRNMEAKYNNAKVQFEHTVHAALSLLSL